MHRLLARQLARHLQETDPRPPGFEAFLESVNRAYVQADEDRDLRAHSMDILSEEFVERYRQLHAALAESQRAKSELTEAVSLMEATLEATADGILVVDTQGRIVRMNQRFLEMWRIPEEVVASRDDARAIAFVLDQLADPTAFVQGVEALYGAPMQTSFDRVPFRDGRLFERYSMPQLVHGTVVGRVWSFRDVTERTQLADQLRQSQKLEAIGHLAGGIAHDFNNLLTVILACGDLAATSLGDDHPVTRDVHEMNVAATRAAKLTQQLLAFGRRQVLRPVPLRLESVVSGVSSMLRRLVGERIHLLTSSAPDLHVVRADPAQIEQVIVNLVVNARDAMPEGGRIVIRTRNVVLDASGAYEMAHGLPGGAHVLLTVSDTGVGIAPEIRERLFEPFFTTKSVGKGSGLGLSTVFGIVAQSGGHITVVSEPGEGTEFRIYLPPDGTVPDTLTPADVPPRQLHGSETVLLVEDEVGVRTIVERMLSRHGYRVLTAASGEEALHLVRTFEGTIDLLLSDVVMPGMSGVDLASQLRARLPGVRVLLMSGHAADVLEGEGMTADLPQLLEKPFSDGSLTRAVREALDQHRPAR